MKKIAYISAFLMLFISPIESFAGSILQIEPNILVQATSLNQQEDLPTSSTKETSASGSPKMSEREFFIAVQSPEYSDYTKKAGQLYNDNKYQESIEISKKVLDLYNERYEDIKKGYEKYGTSKGAQKIFECFPIFQYATAAYAEAAATAHNVHTMPERYFLLLKAHKLYEYLCAVDPEDAKLKGYHRTTKQLFSNATSKSEFTSEEIKAYDELEKPYDFTKAENRTLKNAVELIDKVDKVAKEYKPKTLAPHPEPAKGPSGEKTAELKESHPER